MVNSPLIRPYFLGGVALGGYLRFPWIVCFLGVCDVNYGASARDLSWIHHDIFRQCRLLFWEEYASTLSTNQDLMWFGTEMFLQNGWIIEDWITLQMFCRFFFTLFPTIMEFKWKKILLETSHSSSVWPHFPLSHDSLVGRAIQMNHPEIQQRFPWFPLLLRQTNTLVCIRVMWSFLINRFLGPEEGERQGGTRFNRIDSIFTMELCVEIIIYPGKTLMTWRCFFGGGEQMSSRDDIFNTWRTHDMNGKGNIIHNKRREVHLICLTEKFIQPGPQLFTVWFSIDPTCQYLIGHGISPPFPQEGPKHFARFLCTLPETNISPETIGWAPKGNESSSRPLIFKGEYVSFKECSSCCG